MMLELEIDLCEIIRQALPQIWGSDERELLADFLARNTEQEQVVTVLVQDRTSC